MDKITKLSLMQRSVLLDIAEQPIKCVEYWPPAKALVKKELACFDDGWLVITTLGKSIADHIGAERTADSPRKITA